ncbi:type II toxin-antitoxin system Phd/YefM family antitoxin [Galbibacter mesophilus]|nr:type II toxin-antitoxin system Phd/YefM family antitoxin [Galbibacter mesophilus]
MEVVKMKDFKLNLKYWFDKVINDADEVAIKCKGAKDLVIISLDEYNSFKETIHLLTGKNRDILLNSIKELEAGDRVENDFKNFD